MPEIPRSERKTHNGVIALFADKAQPDCLWYAGLTSCFTSTASPSASSISSAPRRKWPTASASSSPVIGQLHLEHLGSIVIGTPPARSERRGLPYHAHKGV